MSAKRTAMIVLGGGVLAAWLAGAATSNHTAPAPLVVPHTESIDTQGEALANEIARLHDRLRPSAAPRTPGRNLFAFRAAPAPAAPVVPPHAALVEMPLATPALSQPALKLSGVGEDPGPDGPVRMAFISGEGQLFIVKQGDAVTARYKVAAITPDLVELTDVVDGSLRRLVMR